VNAPQQPSLSRSSTSGGVTDLLMLCAITRCLVHEVGKPHYPTIGSETAGLDRALFSGGPEFCVRRSRGREAVHASDRYSAETLSSVRPPGGRVQATGWRRPLIDGPGAADTDKIASRVRWL
jgi:hypothetical protein